jgi:diamine N-acetyltransferase
MEAQTDCRDISIKQISVEGILEIQNIARKTWPNTFGEVMSREQIEYMLDLMYSEDSLLTQMQKKNHVFLLAVVNNEALGFLSYEVDYNSKSQTMVHKIYVLPTAQGLGIGKSLINYVATIAKENGNNQIRLKVFSKNEKAIMFYERFGFYKEGSEISDIGNNYRVLDFVMLKDLEHIDNKTTFSIQ